MAKLHTRMASLRLILVAAAATLFGSPLQSNGSHADPTDMADYRPARTVSLGGSVDWDNLYFDPASRRVFIAHGNEVTVVAGRTGELVGHVQGLDGVHGVAAIPELGKGYAVSRGTRVASSFSLQSLLPQSRCPSDGRVISCSTIRRVGRVFVMDQDATVATVIDSGHDLVVTTLQLGGIAEQAVADGIGHIFINLADNREVIRVDARALKIEARWAIPTCESPHGSAIDSASRRLFVSCLNARLLVLDTTSGRLIATLPIGKGTDGAAYDPRRKRVFSSNGTDGTLSVISQLGPDQYVWVRNVPTARFGRTMALDPDTGRIYIPVADLERIDPHPATKWGAYVFQARLLAPDDVRSDVLKTICDQPLSSEDNWCD